MNRRSKNGLALALIFGAVVTGYFVMPREPRYQGRSLSAWLAELDLESSYSQDKPAEAVRAIGTNALPWLRRMLRSEGPIWERAMVAFNARQSLIQFPITPDNVVHNRALRGYHILGNVAQCDVPKLIQLLETQSSPRVRSYAALALGSIGPAAKEALPVLQQATTDVNNDVRRNAVWAVANIKMWVPDEGMLPTKQF
jgi:HEAT repeat protein